MLALNVYGNLKLAKYTNFVLDIVEKSNQK